MCKHEIDENHTEFTYNIVNVGQKLDFSVIGSNWRYLNRPMLCCLVCSSAIHCASAGCSIAPTASDALFRVTTGNKLPYYEPLDDQLPKSYQIVTVFHPRGKSQNLQIQSRRIQHCLLAQLAFNFIAWYHALARNIQIDR